MNRAEFLLRDWVGYIRPLGEQYVRWRGSRRGRTLYHCPLLEELLPESVAVAEQAARRAPTGKDIFLFSVWHHWVEYSALLGLALAGQGHRVTLAFLPYEKWGRPLDWLTLRQNAAYTRRLLTPAAHLLNPVSVIDLDRPPLPEKLERAVAQVALYDTQYLLQIEEVDRRHPLYQMRYQRDCLAARTALAWLEQHRPQIVIVPNGLIFEFGAVYETARYLDIPVVTYEFGEQNERIWLAQNEPIIQHKTDALWQARRHIPLTAEQRAWLEGFLRSRQTTQRSDSFARLWQEAERQGSQQARAALGLDRRPVVLYTTNVLGDSLTLGRQLLGPTMSDWIRRLMRYFAARPDVQLVVRIHPGENLTDGPSVANVIYQTLPTLPSHIHVIGPKEKINTYDLMDFADVGLVYTTTSGLEMALRGIPVLVAGKTHYRGRGFTLDTDTYEEYFARLDEVLDNPAAHRLNEERLELAWNYAYRFFAEFPRPFPWHILHKDEDMHRHPLQEVLGEAGRINYASTFRYLTGEPLDWEHLD